MCYNIDIDSKWMITLMLTVSYDTVSKLSCWQWVITLMLTIYHWHWQWIITLTLTVSYNIDVVVSYNTDVDSQCTITLTLQEAAPLRCMAFHPSGDYLLVGTQHPTCKLCPCVTQMTSWLLLSHTCKIWRYLHLWLIWHHCYFSTHFCVVEGCVPLVSHG